MIRKIDGLKPKPVIVVLFFQVINLSLRFRSAANFLKIYPEQRIRTSPLTHVESQTPSKIFDFALVVHKDSPRGSQSKLLRQLTHCLLNPSVAIANQNLSLDGQLGKLSSNSRQYAIQLRIPVRQKFWQPLSYSLQHLVWTRSLQ